SAIVRAVTGGASPSKGQSDIVEDGRLEEPDLLLHIPDPLSNLCASGSTQGGPFSPSDQRLPRAGTLQPDQEAQDRRLSRPSRSEDHNEGAARQAKVHRLKERTAFEEVGR